MSDSAIEEIKSRCNIVDVIGRVVTLKKAGSNYKGLCPFHNEKTPSFVVSESKQIFTCFGCGATGDVIEFVERYYNLEFRQAMEKLADECGVVIENDYKKNGHKDKLYEANRQAARFFYKQMRAAANPGWDYMTNRGLDADTMKTFGIGYADAGWDSLYRYMKGIGFDEKLLMEAGLISHSKGKYYDKFRNRVMFPIQNTSGKVIGFGGRIIDRGEPKYLNSPESAVFYKKNNLYGINLTRGDIGREDMAILVEGYMDVISLYQGGVRNVSASLGTALTDNQAKMLKRYTKNVVLSYDSDEAGRAAALRGMDILQREGCRVKVLQVTDGKDPDEFIKKRGREAFIQLTEKAPGFADYKISVFRDQFDIDSIEGRAAFLEKTAEMLKSLQPVEADLYINQIAKDYNISDSAIRAQMKKTVVEHPRRRIEHSARSADSELEPVEKNMIKVLLTDSRYMAREAELEKVFSSEQGRNIYKAMKDVYTDGSEIDQTRLEERLDPDEAAVLREIQETIMLAGNQEDVYRDCIRTASLNILKKREQVIIDRLSLADEDENKEDIRSLTGELIELQRKIKIGGY